MFSKRTMRTDYNGISFSLAWFDNKLQRWNTYFRKFNLRVNGSKNNFRLCGEYSQNLYFDEKINLKENDCKLMIFAIPCDISFKTIFEGFENNELDFILFKDIFILSKKEWAIYSPNLKYFKESYVRLRGNCGEEVDLPTDNILQIKIYDPYYYGRTCNEKEKEIRKHIFGDQNGILSITLPKIEVPLKNIPDWCICVDKEKKE